MSHKKKTGLSRPRHPVPADVKRALERHGVAGDYRARPDYQQNDYIGWIERAKRDTTREKRITQMVDELRRGGIYMGMEHKSSRK